jgi:aspartyl-tRNA synthetase
MANFKRSHTSKDLNLNHQGQNVSLSGWVHRRRDHGNLIFIDLRDRYGIVQLVFDPKVSSHLMDKADKLRSEWVISIKGSVIKRQEAFKNPKLISGDIEVEVYDLVVLSQAKTPPFSICDDSFEVNEDIRLKYRYLDLRRGFILNNLILRHQTMLTVRNTLDALGFLEINTPILGKSTPEGARDYLVPSRIYPGTFYALPQSPQIFKQLLMIGGIDKYFQIATCFRDEDLRSDRQPEFTQIDIEMSFVKKEDIFEIIEELLSTLFQKCLNKTLQTPFQRMTYADCQNLYGTDKPDLRFGMTFIDFAPIIRNSSCPFLIDVLNNEGQVKGFNVKGGHDLSRKLQDEYLSLMTKMGASGLYTVKCQDGALTTGISKFFSPDEQKAIIELASMQEGDLLIIMGEPTSLLNTCLDRLRRRVAKDKNLIDNDKFEFLWVVDFPLFTFNEQERRIESEHHPFTSPIQEDIELIEKFPLKVRSSSYDLVLNGYELASGSERIHLAELQEQIFKILKLSPSELESRFGFFLESLKFGTPPHAGIALGLDRLVMILSKTDNIREVVAFPKTQKASDLMMEAPSIVLKKQLKELKIDIGE